MRYLNLLLLVLGAFVLLFGKAHAQTVCEQALFDALERQVHYDVTPVLAGSPGAQQAIGIASWDLSNGKPVEFEKFVTDYATQLFVEIPTPPSPVAYVYARTWTKMINVTAAWDGLWGVYVMGYTSTPGCENTLIGTNFAYDPVNHKVLVAPPF